MRRVLLVLAVGTVTLAAAWVAAPRLGALAAGATLVPPDDPIVVLDREVTAEFGFENPVLWVLEARAGNVWTPAMLRRLAALTDDVRRIPGVIAPDVIGLASPNMRDLRVTDEGLEPIYLMGEPPTTPEAVAALRRRVDGDPNYAGTLVTRDGRAAMVVANFRTDADPRAVGAAALALRDRHRDADTAVWVVGASVLAVVAPAAMTAIASRAALFALAGLVIFTAVLGRRATAAALLAAVLTVFWIAVGTTLAGGTLPWAFEAALPAALVAAAIGVGRGRPGTLAALLGASALPGALLVGPPARALWIAAGAGGPLAAAAGGLARTLFTPVLRPLPKGPATRLLAAAVALGALLGIPRLGCSLGLFGYGERYLPPAAGADLGAVRRLFPPPLSLALRARGEPGFVTTPEVLHALDAGADAARADAAVRSAMSLADVVKMVHRAFNDERPELFAIPDDRALIGRYLALAYSPTFRRFVDRGFASTVLWVQVEGERPADLARVADRMRAALAVRPVPGATVEGPAGDGAVLLRMARVARRVVGGAVLAVLILAGATWAVAGWRRSARGLGAGAVAAGIGAGLLGWLGQSADLVSVPTVAVLAVATAGLGGLAPLPGRLALGLAGAGAVALAAPVPAAPLLAALLLGPGLAFLLCAPEGARP